MLSSVLVTSIANFCDNQRHTIAGLHQSATMSALCSSRSLSAWIARFRPVVIKRLLGAWFVAGSQRTTKPIKRLRSHAMSCQQLGITHVFELIEPHIARGNQRSSRGLAKVRRKIAVWFLT